MSGEYLTDGMQRAEVTIADHRLRLRVLFEENESRPLPDSSLRAALLDADRFVAELGAAMQAPIGEMTFEERKRLDDYVWRNCTHNEGRGHPNWLICRACVETYFVTARRPR